MCPERQIISVYVDGELPSPWREKLEAHLESCGECRVALAKYKNLNGCMLELPEKTVEAARERVWEKLASSGISESIGQPIKQNREEISQRQIRAVKKVWNSRISLPLPAAAAACLIIAVFLAVAGTRVSRQSIPQEIPQEIAVSAPIQEYMPLFGDDQDILPIQDINGVLQYLSSQEYGDFVVLRLPETRTFSRIGEPALINATDYSRRSLSR